MEVVWADAKWAINAHSSIVSLQNEGVGGWGGMRERKRTTDREKGEADEQTDVRGEGSETDD